MAERDSTQSEFSAAFLAAQRELNEAMHHARLLYALGEGELRGDVIEESDALRIESRALMENMRRLYDMINGNTLAGGAIPRALEVTSEKLSTGAESGSDSEQLKPIVPKWTRTENIYRAVSEIQSIACSLQRIGVDQIEQGEDGYVVYNGVTIKALAGRVLALGEIAELENKGGAISDDAQRMVMPDYIREEPPVPV